MGWAIACGDDWGCATDILGHDLLPDGLSTGLCVEVVGGGRGTEIITNKKGGELEGGSGLRNIHPLDLR